jgi:transcriptional regulator with XRE-family HTH domain
VTQSRRQPPTPDAITAALGRRLAELRKAVGIRSQEELGNRMTKLGVRWSRVSVEKLENGRRGAITVQELLALALVLDVSPALLLADPRTVEKVPVGKVGVTDDDPGRDVELDAWTALLWLCGMARPDEQVDAVTYGHRSEIIADGLRLAGRIELLMPQLGDGLALPEMKDVRESYVRQLIESIAASLWHIDRQGAPLPALPSRIVRAAVQLGIELPGLVDEHAITQAQIAQSIDKLGVDLPGQEG